MVIDKSQTRWFINKGSTGWFIDENQTKNCQINQIRQKILTETLILRLAMFQAKF